MDNKSEEKNCFNCGYFHNYYIKNRASFKPVAGNGICICTELKSTISKKHLRKKIACEFWRPEELREKELTESVKNMLIRICRELEKIATLLQNDN